MYFPQTRCRESVGTCGGYVQVFQPNFQYHLLISLFTPPISLVTPYRRALAAAARSSGGKRGQERVEGQQTCRAYYFEALAS